MKSRLALMCLLPSLAFAQAVENVTPGNISFGGGSLTFDGDSLNSSVALQAPRFEAVADAKLTLGGASVTGQDAGFTWDYPGTIPGVTTYGVNSQQLSTPVNSTFSATTGTLDDGTYCYRVAALDVNSGYTLASTETCLAVSGGAGSNGVTVTWGKVTGATGYRIYGRLTGAELLMATVSAPALTWTDDGSLTPSGSLPGANITGSLYSGYLVNTTYLEVGNVAHVGSMSTLVYSSGNTNYPISLKGREASDGSAVCWKVSNSQTQLVTAGDLIMAWYNDAETTKVAHVDYLGGFLGSSYTTSGFSAGASGLISLDSADESGTPGDATINKPLGRVAVAASASTVTVTNSLVLATSHVVPVVESVDATCIYPRVTPASGSFTITMDAACTANTTISFHIINPK